ncbi:hypothetical protein H0H87_007383 [Tephrocybe sp. NHM501043]|nr:hypothetical protein H0H87_007383 [Tephrocybe sp. NHM501043]
MSNSTFQVLCENAPYHSKLISTIAELDYVPLALEHQTSYVDELQTRLKQSEARLKSLSETTKKERKEHESLRDSTARRLAHKLTGRKEKFHAMATKEEHEYVDALEKEFAERDAHGVLITMLDEAEREKADLMEKATHHDGLKQEISALYRQVFDGPTEEYPEDDRLEHQVHSTQALYDKIQNTLNAECRACEILAQADRTMNACEVQIKDALAHSQRAWIRYHDVWERNALSLAQATARQTQDLCQQARNVSPLVEPIGPLAIARGCVLSIFERQEDLTL